MRKIIASAGLVAVGTASLQAAYAPGLTPQETAKPWSVSASLMGFYDDNYNTAPSGTNKNSSVGFLFKPSAALNLAKDQTLMKFGLDYGLYYYADRPKNQIDQSVQLLAKVDHVFSERYRLNASDSFVYASEPEVVDPSLATPRRAKNDAVRNFANIDFMARVTELLTLEPGFDCSYYNYFEDGPGSYSALLDRVNYAFRLDGRYQAREDLVGIVGYTYGYADYTSSDLLGVPQLGDDTTNWLRGKDRTYSTHAIYVGADYNFTSQLKLTGRVGAQYAKFKVLTGSDGWSPYADIQGTYTYLPDSYVQLGLRVMQYATDVVGDPTSSADTTGNQQLVAVYAGLNHKITPRITGNLMVQYQHSRFNGGSYDGQGEDFILAGLSVEYRIDNFWSVVGAYNFDDLMSNLSDRSYTRNRGYIGVNAKF